MSILALQRRYRTIGRLRMGTKNAKGEPVRLATWRLTSDARGALHQAAELWGGEARPWRDEQWEVVTETSRIPVIVPDQDVDRAQRMEHWGSGGLLRECDTETCYTPTERPGVRIEQPCLCADDDETVVCKPTTRLNFFLPDLDGIGCWTLTSTGRTVAAEFAAEVATLAGKNLEVTLTLTQREHKSPGQPTHRFVVPVLETPLSLRQIMVGGAQLQASNVTAVAALPQGVPGGEQPGKEHGADTDASPVSGVGEELHADSPPGPPLSVPSFITDLADRATRTHFNALQDQLLDGPPDGKMDDNEAALRMLFRNLEGSGLIDATSPDALHLALSKRGARHVRDLKAAELRKFVAEAWGFAQTMMDAWHESQV